MQQQQQREPITSSPGAITTQHVKINKNNDGATAAAAEAYSENLPTNLTVFISDSCVWYE